MFKTNNRNITPPDFLKIYTLLVIGIAGLTLLAGCTSKQKGKAQNPVKNPAFNPSQLITEPVNGQILYVPVYSHIYQRDQMRTFDLTATLSIRNTDMASDIQVTKVEYYDSHGKLLRSYIKEPHNLNALSSVAYVIDEKDLAGGVGANFIVEWRSDTLVSAPVSEAVMISTANQQGVSFLSSSVVIESLGTQPPRNGNSN